VSDEGTEIRRIVAEVELCSAAVERLVAGRPPELLLRRPEDGGWSVAQCIEHLNVTARATLPTIVRAIAQGRAQGLLGTGPFAMDFVGRMLRWSLDPPVRLKLKTPAAFIPSAHLSPEHVVKEFRVLQGTFIDAIRSSEGIQLDAITVRSVFEERVRYNLYAAYLILAAHERRHIRQAEQALGNV
jgi:hypothetical protein